MGGRVRQKRLEGAAAAAETAVHSTLRHVGRSVTCAEAAATQKEAKEERREERAFSLSFYSDGGVGCVGRRPRRRIGLGGGGEE